MTNRGRQTYALLRTMLAWIPAPASRGGLHSVPRGFVSGVDGKGRPLRYVTCPDCLTNGRVLPGCETCAGRGELPDAGPDPYQQPVKGFYAHVEPIREAERRRDAVITRLEQEALVRAGKEASADSLTRAVELRDRLYRAGSYAELERALGWLRERSPVGYAFVLGVCYQPFAEPPVEPQQAVIRAVCELLATRMPERIRVPRSVAVFTAEELEARSRLARDALAHGRNGWASASRAQRKRLIVTLAGEGLSDTAIARRLGLQRQRVQQIRAGLLSTLEDAATSGTAA